MSMEKLILDGDTLDPQKLYEFSKFAWNPKAKFSITLSESARKRVQSASNFVEQIVNTDAPVYGINTGFGKFSEVKIDRKELEELQKNLIFSHACGVGKYLDRDIVLMMWILRLNTICRGNTGVRLSTVDHVIQALEKGLLANIPSRGSVGASGDLAPSAHATLCLLGEGTCTLPEEDRFISLGAKDALIKLQLSPLKLGPKEGLSLINGTQLTTALAIKVLCEGLNLVKTANLALSLSIEGMRASHRIAAEQILNARVHPGAIACGQEIRQWLNGPSQVKDSHLGCHKIQDPYSLRCAPQVHGAILDDLLHANTVLSNEMNSSTDNPLLFPEEALSLSGGNFHAIFPARVNDHLASGLTILSSISERRIAQMMSSSSSGLPAFLVHKGGLNSGYMMSHVTAAALVSESKSLSFPAGVDSIPTSDDKEDHVSMGPGAGFKAINIVENTRGVLAIEILSSLQAIDLLAPLKTTPKLQRVYNFIRSQIPPLENDRILANEIELVSQMILERSLFQ